MTTHVLRKHPFRLLLACVVVCMLLLWRGVPPVHVAPPSAYLLLSALPGAPVGPINALLGQPRVQTIHFAGSEGDITADLYHPVGGGAHPALLIVNGALSEGRAYPPLVAFCRALARAGYAVLVPDYPDLLREELTPASLSDVELTLRRLPVLVNVGQRGVEIIGFCVGGTLSLLAVENPATPPVRAVIDLAGYASNADLIQLITTGTYTLHGRLFRFPPDPWLVVAVARSLVTQLPNPADRAQFAPYLVDPSPTHNVAPNWQSLPADHFSAGGRALLAVLENHDAARVPALIAALPAPMPTVLQTLSPEAQIAHLQTPVYILDDRADTYIPPAESRKLKERSPHFIHLTYVSILSHVEPTLQAKGNVLATVVDTAKGAWQLFAAIDRALVPLPS